MARFSLLACVAFVLVLAVVPALSQQPFITAQPVDSIVAVGSPATFTVSTATGTPVYQWYVSIDNGATFTQLTNVAPYSGTTTATLTVNPSLASYDGYQFRVAVRQTGGALQNPDVSNTVRLVIIKNARILVQPADVLVDTGATATFSVTAAFETQPTYSWETSVDSGLTWTAIAGATAATYSVATTPAMLYNRFRVKLTTAGGFPVVSSNAAVLRVGFITITTQPASATVSEGSQASYSIAYTSYPPATVKWQATNGVGGALTDVPGGSGAQTTTYTTVPTTFAMNGLSFAAVVNNGRTTLTSASAGLAVNRRLVILQQPVDLTVSAGATATFTVVASGTSPITYRWQVSVKGGAFTDVAGANAATLTLTGTTSTQNQNRYRVLVSTTDALGTTTLISRVATLTVLYAPVITQQPQRPLVIVSDLVTLSVGVDANPAATYQWQLSNVNSPALFQNIAVDATGPSYRVRSIPTLDSIYYRVIVSNSQGTVISDVVELRVNFPRA